MKRAGVVFELIGFIGTGFLIGSFLDQIGEKQGIFQAGGIILAFLLWIIFVWKRLQS